MSCSRWNPRRDHGSGRTLTWPFRTINCPGVKRVVNLKYIKEYVQILTKLNLALLTKNRRHHGEVRALGHHQPTHEVVKRKART